MKTITKAYKTLTQAERYQNRLYNQFDSVQLTAWPMFSEQGRYTWTVASNLNTQAANTAEFNPKNPQ